MILRNLQQDPRFTDSKKNLSIYSSIAISLGVRWDSAAPIQFLMEWSVGHGEGKELCDNQFYQRRW